MYIEEIILESFKTYMNRTVISGFDSQFNAITGLNGSGKSNILDAIQFLLGSTSKDMLRLKTSLTQLIYKQGFAGIEKASVTIKFRCLDKQMRPTGYDNCQELIVTRQITKDKITKFFINGVTSNLTKVRNLFRSVQLNIQNPHFLIKQGQITKIINLKPLELLGMIEQTAGTAYYNKTKTESQKIIQKKQQKLKAINEILQQSIEPQMQKLDADRRRYIAFKDKQSLLIHLNQKLRIYELTFKKRHLRQRQLDLSSSGQNISIKKRQLNLNQQRLQQLQKQQKLLTSKSTNSHLGQYNKIKSLVAQKQNERNQIRGRIKKLNNQAITSKQQIMEKQRQLQQRKKDKQWLDKTLLQIDKQKQQIQSLIQQFGRSNNQKDTAQLVQKQISQQQARVQSITAQMKIINNKKESLKQQIENDKKLQAQMKQSNQNLQQSLKQIQDQIQYIQKMQPPKPEDDPDLTSTTLKQLQNAKKRLIGQYYQLNFYYNDPYPGFDRKKVKGKLFMLFRTKQKIHEKALQIGAGGRLFNIVVQNQIVAKQLVQKQSFGKNITLIPNNKIKFGYLNQDAVSHAAKIAKQMGGLARPAYQLINYSKQIQNSIMFGFSNFIVCSSSEIAQKIAYNSNRHLCCKCVTYDGDIYEQGTLSGGYMNQTNMILPQFSQLCQIEDKINAQKIGYESQRQKYEQYQKNMNEYRNKQKQLQNKISRRQKIKNKLMNFTLRIKKHDYNKQIADIQAKLKQLNAQKQLKTLKLQQLKNNVKNKNIKSLKQQKIQLQAELKKAITKITQTKKKISNHEVHIEQLKITIKHLAQTCHDLQKQILDLQKKQRQVSSYLREYQIQFQRVEEQKKKHERQLMINEAKYKSIITQQSQIKSIQQKIQQQIYQIQNSTQNAKKQIVQIKRFLDNLCQKYPWLDPQEQYEIQASFNYQVAKNQYKIVQGQVDKLKRSAKMNIDDHSYQKLHEQYKNLMSKRQTLQSDKITLLNNMHELDQKRTKTLQKCYQSVKINLTKIFSDLLPGATAHITLVDQHDVTKGAQLNVHFNKVKKQLSQLSGGQRSLLALSFILALLLYKPSPFYILDQIDSALDLSHTQNIGYMISQRFPQSQFIIISLKQGMFQNANVLYKVHFAQGESKVQRQTLRQIGKKK